MTTKTRINLMILTTAIVFFAMGYLFANILISSQTIAEKELKCPDTEEFGNFFKKFNDNIRFQKERTLFPLNYHTLTDENSPEHDIYLIESSQWTPLDIIDHAETIIYVNYENHTSAKACDINVIIEGIHRGIKIKLHFTDVEGEWYLTTLKDYSL